MYINIVFTSVSVFKLNIAFSFLKGEGKKKLKKKNFKFTRRKKQIISLLFIVCHIYIYMHV